MRVFLIIAILFITACAIKSPQSLSEEKPVFTYNGKISSFPALTECIFEKLEKFPVVAQLFDFEDKTLPVQIRQFSDNAELYQAIQSRTLSLIKLQKISSNKAQAKLYVSTGLYSDNVKDNYPTLIKDCFK